MDTYGIFILIYLYILRQNKFNLVKCVLVTSPEQPASQSSSQAKAISSDSEDVADYDDLALIEGDDSLESTENSDDNIIEVEDSVETNDNSESGLPKDLKITTEGSTKINDENRFVVHNWSKNNNDCYKVEFNDDARCCKVEAEDSLIWKYAGGFRRPLTLLYEPNLSILLKFYDGYSKFDKTANTNEWLEECDIKLYSTDPHDISKSIKLDNTQYKTTKNRNVVTFEFQPGVQCEEVRFVEKKPDVNDPRRIRVIFKTVWKRWSIFGDESPTINLCPSSLMYKNNSRVILRFGDQILIRERDMNNNWHTLNDEVQMFTIDPNNPGSTVEIDHSQYLHKYNRISFEWEFKPEVKCVQVMVNDHSVWNYDHKNTLNKFPREVSYARIFSRLVLRFETCSVVCFKDRGGNWLNYKNYNYTDIGSLSSTVDSTDSTSLGMAWDTFGGFIDQEVYETNDPGSFPSGWHTYGHGGVELEADSSEDTLDVLQDIELVDLSDPKSKVSSSGTPSDLSQTKILDGVKKVAKAKKQRGTTKVKDSRSHGTMAGKSTDADDVQLSQDDLFDLILTMNDELERLKRDYSQLSGQLENANSQKNITPIKLDISSEQSSNNVKCTVDGDTLVYTPMAPYTFKMVTMNKIAFWHTLKPSEYSNKVELTWDDKVIVHKVDGTKEEFELSTKKEHVKISNTTTPPLKTIHEYDPEMESYVMRDLYRESCISEPEERASSKQPSPKQESVPFHLASPLINDDDSFDIDLIDPVVNNSRDKEIKGQRLEQPQHVDDQIRLPKEFQPIQQLQQPKIVQNAEPLHLVDQKPSQQTIQLINLELTDRKSSQYVTYEVNNKKRREKFTCIPPYRVFQVVHNGQLVWSSPNQSYPNRVLVKPSETGIQMAYMFLPEDKDEGVNDGPDVDVSEDEHLSTLVEDSRPAQDNPEPLKPLQQLQPVQLHQLQPVQQRQPQQQLQPVHQPQVPQLQPLQQQQNQQLQQQYQQYLLQQQLYQHQLQQQQQFQPQQQFQHQQFPGFYQQQQFPGYQQQAPQLQQAHYDVQHVKPQQQQQQEQQNCYTLITVRVDQLQSTSEVDYAYDQDNDVHRFIAKEWCLIEKVMKGNKIIWSPKTDYGIELEIKFAKSDQEKDKLTVFFPTEEEKAQKNIMNHGHA